MTNQLALVGKHFAAGLAGNPLVGVSHQVSFIGRGAIELFATLGADMAVIIVNLELVSGLQRPRCEHQVTEPTFELGLRLRCLPGSAVARLVDLQAVTVLEPQPTHRTGSWTGAVGLMGLLVLSEGPGCPVLFITEITLQGNGGVSGLVLPQMILLCELFVTFLTLE